jgi:hypothetical protein
MVEILIQIQNKNKHHIKYLINNMKMGISKNKIRKRILSLRINIKIRINNIYNNKSKIKFKTLILNKKSKNFN